MASNPREQGQDTAPLGDRAPWEREPGETEKQYAAFEVYRELGPSRSLDAVGESLYPGVSPGAQMRRKRASTGRLQDWSRDRRWVSRAGAWDEHLAQQRRDAEEARLKRDVEEAADRRRTLREQSWADYLLLRAAVLALLQKGQERALGPKDVRELALSRDRLAILAREAFQGLEAPAKEQAPDMPPELAAEFERWLASRSSPILPG